MDMVLERVRAANPAQARQADYEDLFREIVATPCDPQFARRRPRRVTGPRLVLVALIAFLLLAGVATATYFAVRASDALTTFPRGNSLVAVAASGAASGRPLWQCPGGADWCGDIAGAAWSPDGEQLALSLGELGGDSPYVGFHIIDPRTRTDQHIPSTAPLIGTDQLFPSTAMLRRFGCAVPSYLAWSPDGNLLAYTCRDMAAGPSGNGAIYTIRPDGTGRRRIPTGPFSAFSPTWSPDGKRLAFSTGEMPFPLAETPVSGRRNMTGYVSHVYVIDLDGSHARRVATGALPDWSPDGKTIAYFGPGCVGPASDNQGRIRLVTPTGRDVTPPTAPCAGIGPTGHPVPAWSPDGRQIAVGTDTGLYVMNASGTDLQQVEQGRKLNSTALWGYLRPAWRPK